MAERNDAPAKDAVAEDDAPPVRRSPYDAIRVPPEHRRLRRLPALTRGAVALVWRAAPRQLIGSAVLQIIGGAGIAGQLLAGRAALTAVIDASEAGRGYDAAVAPLAVLVAITAVLSLAATVQEELTKVLQELVAKEAADEILDVATTVDLEAYETPAFHDRLERARLNAQTRPVSAVRGLLGLLSAVAGCVGVIAVLATLEPLLLPLTLAAAVPLWLATSRNSRTQYDFASEMTATDRERNHIHGVLISREMAKEVRAFNLTGFMRSRFDDLWEHRITSLRGVVRQRLRRALLGGLASAVLMGGTVGFLVLLLRSDRLSLAGAGTAVWGVSFLGQRLRSVVSGVGSIYECSLFIEDINLFLELRRSVADQPTPAGAPRTFDRLRVDGVTFTYPGSHQPAVRDVTMEIGRGEVVALVGDNGSGKTTLAKILASLYTPDSGAVLWDDVAVDERDRAEVRRSIALIFQDFGRYWLPARENIGIGDTGKLDDLDAIVAAAHTAGADSFIERLPHGYDTVLSRLFEGGRDLSIGQWQRVALARAFFRDAPLLIMDEPTASLDAASEHRLFASMRELLHGRSALLISHRFSTVRKADRIYVLDDGTIIESGTHDELMAVGGTYATMFSLQAAAYLPEDATTLP